MPSNSSIMRLMRLQTELTSQCYNKKAALVETISTTTISPRDRKKHDPEDFRSREVGQYQSRSRRTRFADAGGRRARGGARHSGREERLYAASRTARVA